MDLTSYLLGKKSGGGGPTPIYQKKTLSITTNNDYEIKPDQDYDALSEVDLTVNVQPDLESKSITITTNTTTTITPSQDKDGLSSVEVITNVPSGISINGTLENKTITIGSVLKGDFVTFGGTKSITDNSVNYHFKPDQQSTIINANNINDGNDNTYATVSKGTGNTSNPIVFVPSSASQLGIPLTSKLISLTASYKVQFPNATSANIGRLALMYWDDLNVSTFVNLLTVTTVPNTSIISGTTDNIIAAHNNEANPSPSKLQNFGLRFDNPTLNTNVFDIYVYEVSFTIEYEDDGKVKTITSDAEQIIGIANENGSSGDTIQVYVPNISL